MYADVAALTVIPSRTKIRPPGCVSFNDVCRFAVTNTTRYRLPSAVQEDAFSSKLTPWMSHG